METFFKTFLMIFLPGLVLCMIIAMIGFFSGGDGDLSIIAAIFIGYFCGLLALAGGLIAVISEKIDEKYRSNEK